MPNFHSLLKKHGTADGDHYPKNVQPCQNHRTPAYHRVSCTDSLHSFIFICMTFNHRNSGVSVQDPFSDSSDPAFQKRANVPPGMMYQQGGGGMDARMQYDANKEPYGGQRKGESILLM